MNAGMENAGPAATGPEQRPSPGGPRSARQFPWTKAEDALLGKNTDREVAERLNRTVAGVRDRRKHLGLRAASQPPQPVHMEREPRDGYAHLFATKSDREIRALLGWSFQRIHARRRQLARGKVRKLQPECARQTPSLGHSLSQSALRNLAARRTDVAGDDARRGGGLAHGPFRAQRSPGQGQTTHSQRTAGGAGLAAGRGIPARHGGG